MRASAVIEQLQQLVKKYGDHDLTMADAFKES